MLESQLKNSRKGLKGDQHKERFDKDIAKINRAIFLSHSVDCCTISLPQRSFYFCCNQSSADGAVFISSKKTDESPASPSVTAVIINIFLTTKITFSIVFLDEKNTADYACDSASQLRRSCNSV